MTDWDTLRALADEGNEKAMDRLADLADERGDVEALNELLDEGNERAGERLTRQHAAAAKASARAAGRMKRRRSGEVLDRLL